MSPALTTRHSSLTLVECPRDAMQGWHSFIPTDQKIRYLNSLLKVGFDTLDFGSFVSPKAIPQLADTRDVLAALDTQHSSTKLLAIVANTRGAEDAVGYDAISCLGFPFSVSPTFQQRNTNSTQAESLQRVEQIQALCTGARKELVIYLSMGFGNPYGDPYSADELLRWAEEMVKRGVRTISLADTVGLAKPEQIRFAMDTLLLRYPDIHFGVHLHAAAGNWQNKLEAAWDAGCRRFDGALKGIGGCPMAQDVLVGNMDTEQLVRYFENRGIALQLDAGALKEALQLAAEIFV